MKILVVDEDLLTGRCIQKVASSLFITAAIAPSLEMAKEKLHLEHFDLIFCAMEESPEFEVIHFVKKLQPHALVVFLCQNEEVDGVIEAMHLGAFYCCRKPLSQAKVEEVLERARKQIIQGKPLGNPIKNPHHIIAESPAMKKILADVETIAKSQASVFISGESGTGKEEIAHAVHIYSNRSTQPFIKVNCAAIPETLIESEFFGHEKGAFTGAVSSRFGRFELANQGTLLLDEISEIPLTTQAKLLRAIQEQEFERVGGMKPIRVDVRIISTSNRNMLSSIDQKIFREDLYYRLNVMPIHLPPLRERKEDILPLAEYFLEKFCNENAKKKKSLTSPAKEKLLEYPWPGNIRQLANVIERLVVMVQEDKIDKEDIALDPITRNEPVASVPIQASLQEIEKKHILETLSAKNQNRTKAAKALGISIRTLRNKLREYNLAN